MRAYDFDLRRKIVDAYERGDGTFCELSEIFHLAVGTIWAWVHRARTGEGLAPRYHGSGVAPMIDGEVRATLAQLVEVTPTATCTELAQQLVAQHGVHPSRMTVSRALADLKITRKKVTPRATEQDRPGVQEERAHFRHRQVPWDAARIVVLDEFGTNLGMARHYGWAPCGDPAVPSVPKNPGENITLIFGLRPEGPVAPSMFRGAMDEHVMESYVRDYLGPELRPGDIVLMDNLQAHHCDEVVAAIEARGARAEFLPPYSPEFSPIEMCGSKVKTWLRRIAARAYGGLIDGVGDALRAVTPDEALNYFEAAGYHVKAA